MLNYLSPVSHLIRALVTPKSAGGVSSLSGPNILGEKRPKIVGVNLGPRIPNSQPRFQRQRPSKEKQK